MCQKVGRVPKWESSNIWAAKKCHDARRKSPYFYCHFNFCQSCTFCPCIDNVQVPAAGCSFKSVMYLWIALFMFGMLHLCIHLLWHPICEFFHSTHLQFGHGDGFSLAQISQIWGYNLYVIHHIAKIKESTMPKKNKKNNINAPLHMYFCSFP